MPKTSDGNPYLTVGYNELVGLPELGKTIKCWLCGKDHAVKHSKKKMLDGTWEEYTGLGFMQCGGATYLCGVGGKEWRPKDS